MIRVWLYGILIALCGLSGCVVELTKPIGTKVNEKSLKRYESTWLIKGDEHSTIIRLDKHGELKSATAQWNEDESRFELEEYPLDLRKVGNHVYAFTEKDKVLTFAKWVEKDADTIELMFPTADKFREVAKKGLLEIDKEKQPKNKSDVRIVADEKLEKLLASEEIDAYFDKNATITLQRYGKSLKE